VAGRHQTRHVEEPAVRVARLGTYLRRHRRRPQRRRAQAADRGRSVSGHRQDDPDGFNPRDYLEGKSEKSARNVFFYFSGATPSAVRYKNWKMYYTMSQPGGAGWIMPLVPFHFTLVANIKRDPFEQAVGIDLKSATALGGSLSAPATAFLYDWNMLPIGQQLWLKHLTSYEKFPPLQQAESYNLSQVLDQVKRAGERSASE
jgi:arylsulfatase